MSLRLEFGRREGGFEVGPQKSHSVKLITFASETHPHEMKVIRHEAVDGTDELFANHCVKKKFTERGVMRIAQPLGRTVERGQRPDDNGVALVVFAGKSSKQFRPRLYFAS